MVSAVAPTFSASGRNVNSGRRHRRPQEGNRVEAGAEDLGRIRTQMAGEDLLVDGAEVHCVLEVACGIEVGETGLSAIESAPDRVADEQERRGGSMVCASASVLHWAT